MIKQTFNNIKLGIFVLAGLFLLIFTLYMIGKNQNLLGNTFKLNARFDNVRGLMPGNNVRFSGIEVGTVRRINIINDTVIEVEMRVDEKVKKFIRKNALASIGSDGLMGNRVINISPMKKSAPLVKEGDILPTIQMPDTDEMLQTLYKTNNNLSEITNDLKSTVQQINKSKGLWSVLNDTTLSLNLKTALKNIQHSTGNANAMVTDLRVIINDVKSGKGAMGALLYDTDFSTNLNEAVAEIKSVGENANLLTNELNKVVKDVNSGKGTVNALLKDSILAMKIDSSLSNIEKGTALFNENMEAMRHNFLLKGYFKKQEKQEKQKKKETEKKNSQASGSE